MMQSNRLKEVREAASVSQDYLADALSTGRSTIVKLEKGERTLTIEWCERIAPVLKCAPWDLLPADKSDAHKEMELRLRYRAMTKGQQAAFLAIGQQMAPTDPLAKSTPLPRPNIIT